MGKLIVTDAHARHQRAVAAFATSATAIAPEMWHVAQTAGKWSPAEITTHLELGFRALQQELAGGPPMRLRLRGWKLLYARWRYMRRILADGVFPTGARAPRETRPPAGAASQAVALEAFRAAAANYETEVLGAHAVRPETRLTHPYFGRVSLSQALFISAKHIEHHSRQLNS